MTDELEQSRATNRELHRRLQQCEGPLITVAAKAVSDAGVAVRALGEMQLQRDKYFAMWSEEWRKRYDDSLWGPLIKFLLLVWAVTMTVLWWRK